MTFHTLNDIDVQGKTVLLRADLNVPVQDGTVTDTTRIDRLKPTFEALKDRAEKIIILSHFGRPKGQENPKYSLAFLPPILTQQWGVEVGFGKDSDQTIVLLENLRFDPREETNDPEFAKELASLGDIFIHDAFSTSHRAHASTEGLAHLLPSAAGLLMEAELKALSQALEQPQKPVMAIVGGSKISTKLNILNNLVKKVDYLVLGGGMANTFLFANNQMLGKSLYEYEMVNEAREIQKIAKEHNCEIILPEDCIVTDELKEGIQSETTILPQFPDDKMAVDIGAQSIEYIKTTLKSCKTILWNGPLGVFEIKPFDHATNEIAHEVAELTKQGSLVSVAGGGDTVAALENAKVSKDFSYISTAGGAFLEWIEGKELPGVAALHQNAKKAA
ncbi:MAG: phosphoglycerate kinase [Pseudomonadota bacterium]